MTRTLSFFGFLGILFLAAAILCLPVANQTHATTKHVESLTVRQSYQRDLCEGTELWYAPVRGTILVLCGVSQSSQWGGIVYRVTENNGDVLLSGDELYECTAFVAGRKYWDGVIYKGGYFPLLNYPSLTRYLRGQGVIR